MTDFLRNFAEYGSEWLTQLPWLLLGLASLPLVIAALRARIYPTIWWVGLLCLSVLASILSTVSLGFLALVIIVDGVIVIATAIDFLMVWVATRHGISASRQLPRTCSIGVPLDSEITIENNTIMKLSGAACDDLPEHFQATPTQHNLALPSGGRLTAQRKLTPGRRGAFILEHVYLKFFSPLHLWERHIRLDVRDKLNVYPDMKQLSDYALLARTNRLSLIGVRRTRRIGQDSEFERLRDYTRDDNHRHIDWRSTARRNKLTVKQFQSDQSQRVIFMLDCGRMMTNERNGYSLLDHALNSALMMAYVALHQGDSVGMLCFSDTIHAYIPPQSGASQMNRLIQAGFDQFPRLVESRYDKAFLHLSNHCKRRSLVTLTTNIVDEVNAGAVVDYLGNLNGQHLPLGVLLRDREMFDAADAPGGEGVGGDEMPMYRAAVASDILVWRDQVIKDLQHRGVLIVDAFPDELTAPLVNQYLDVKAKHLL